MEVNNIRFSYHNKPFIDDLSADSIKEVYYNDYYVAVVDQISSVKYTNNKSDFNFISNNTYNLNKPEPLFKRIETENL